VPTQPPTSTDVACGRLQQELRRAWRIGRIPLALVTCPGLGVNPEPLNVRLDYQALSAMLRLPDAPVRPTEAVERAWLAHYQRQLQAGEIGLGLVGVRANGEVILAPWVEALATTGVSWGRVRVAISEVLEEVVSPPDGSAKRHLVFVDGADPAGGGHDLPEEPAC
jgi:hypothetical protein